MVTLTADDRTIQAPLGSSVLAACLAAGIYIPHLCWLKTDTPSDAPASCRLCFVEVDGLNGAVSACTLTVSDGMTVNTHTDAVRRLQRAALRLLLSVHRLEGKHCPANQACALQNIARFLGIGLNCKPYERILKQPDVDRRHPVLDYYPNRCVLCGICVRICRQQHRRPLLSFAGRGFETVVGCFGEDPQAAADCLNCRACLEACPTRALIERTTAEG